MKIKREVIILKKNSMNLTPAEIFFKIKKCLIQAKPL